MSERGVYGVDRGVWEHPLFQERKPFSRREAWLWLVSEAAWKARRVRHAGQTITLQRGQLAHSIRFMANAWRWEKTKVERFFDDLKTETMIATETATGITVTTIYNYDKYQVVGLPDATPAATDEATAARQDRDSSATNKKKENIEEGKEDIRAVAKATRPDRDEKFEEFWRAYPRRKGSNPRKPAKDQWDTALKRGADPDAIITAVKAGAGFDRDKIGTEYIPQAVKWLRDQRFNDFEKPDEAATVSGYYAAFGSPQLDAWDAHNRKTTGRTLPRDRKGGWVVSSEWPPGYDPPRGGAEFLRGQTFSESIQ